MAGSSVTHSVYAHSQTQSVSIHNEQDEIFNYELVHLRYLEACEDYFNTPYSITGPWTKKARNCIINSIKANCKVSSLMNLVYKLHPNVLEQYQIVLDDGDEKLVLAGTSIEVLPYEECFDIFVELHKKTGHGGFDVILKKLENTFLVNDTCLNVFLLNCDICKKFNLQSRKHVAFNDSVNIEILKAPIQDHNCRFILFYIDKVTTFMLCRPLIAMDEFEISIEILKIFTDFGPPVVINTIHAPLFNNVLRILEHGGFNYDISINASDKVIGESFYLMQQIVARTNGNSNYWSTICRFIQYRHNNGQLPLPDTKLNKVVHAAIKPFNQVFNTKHSSKNESLFIKSSEQNKKKSTSSILDKSSNLRNSYEDDTTTSGTSDTDTASETEELQSMQTVKIEAKSHSSEHQSRGVLKITNNDTVEMDEQTSYNRTINNTDTINSNEIKIEYNPIQTDCSQNSNPNQKTFILFNVPKIEQVNTVAEKTDTPLIVDSIPVKTEPVLEEPLSPSTSSNTTDVLPNPGLETNATQKYFSVGTNYNDSKRINSNDRTDVDYCSACKGKMLTDYFCFGCKKKTHIFCMNRVTNPLEKITDTVISYTYCELCLKAKYNLSNAVKINN